MKKHIAIFISLILFVTILSGCSSSSASVEENKNNLEINSTFKKKVIQVMTWGDESDMKKNINAFNQAYPDLKDKFDIQVLIGGKGNLEVAEKYRLAIASQNNIPDIIEFNRSDIIEFAEADELADVSNAYLPYKRNVLDSAIQMATYKGKLFGFPYEVKLKLWFYRKDMFDTAGIDPKNVKNLNDFIKAGKKLHEKFPKSYIWNIGPQMGSMAAYNIGMILSGNGARFVNENGNYVVTSDPGVRAAFEAFKKIKDAKITIPINDWTPDWEKAFADSTIASSPCSDWLKVFLPRYANDQVGKWAVAQFPEIGGAIGGSDAGGSLFAITADSKEKDIAMEFLSKLFLTKQGNLAMRKQVGHESWSVLLKDALLDPSVQLPDPYFGVSLNKEEAKAANTFKMFNFTPTSGIEFTIINQYLDKYLSGTQSLDDVLNEAENDLKNQLGNSIK
jgi:ABC-type glycerol-3-phosphate transport system substrate-binding protein